MKLFKSLVILVMAIVIIQAPSSTVSASPVVNISPAEKACVCGEWGWGDIPPPDATIGEIEDYFGDVFGWYAVNGCDHCTPGLPDTPFKFAHHICDCDETPKEFNDPPVNIPYNVTVADIATWYSYFEVNQ